MAPNAGGLLLEVVVVVFGCVAAWEFAKDDPHPRSTTRTAAVVPLRSLDECRQGLVSSIAASTTHNDIDVWVLLEEKAPAPPLEYDGHGLRYTRRNDIYLAQQPGVNASSIAWRRFCNAERSGFSKGSFAIFVASGPYGMAWLVEDDVFFTGSWGFLFAQLFSVGNAAAVVYASKPKGHHWPWGARCFYDDEPCAHVYARLATSRHHRRELWPIGWFFIGLSSEFAKFVVSELDVGRLWGHHEAATALLCAQFPSCRFAHIPSTLRTPRGFYFSSGSWLQRDLTLEAAAKRDALPAPLPRHLWHPVKCEADPSLGRQALRWAAANLTLSSSSSARLAPANREEDEKLGIPKTKMKQ